MLINRLPSLVELLGEEYPLFFNNNDLQGASAKAEDMTLIGKAHEYLSTIPVDRFSQASFRESIASADFYRDL